MHLADWVAKIAIMLPVFLVSLSVHEFCHALTATVLGDDTPKNAGRLTLNPLAHVNFLGLAFLLLVHIGWANPVIFDHRNFKHPKLYTLFTAMAGPLSNFILALLSMYALVFVGMNGDLFSLPVMKTFIQILQAFVGVNIMLGAFNLLPIPPLDGGHFIMVFLSEKAPDIADWLYRYSLIILLVFLFLPHGGGLLLNKLFVIFHKLLSKLVFL